MQDVSGNVHCGAAPSVQVKSILCRDEEFLDAVGVPVCKKSRAAGGI